MTPILMAGILFFICVGFAVLAQCFEWLASRLPSSEHCEAGVIRFGEWVNWMAVGSAGMAILSAVSIVGVCVFAVVLGMFTPFI